MVDAYNHASIYPFSLNAYLKVRGARYMGATLLFFIDVAYSIYRKH